MTPALFCGVVFLAAASFGSEFPDRECCDSAPPPPPQYHTSTSQSSTSTTTMVPGPPYGNLEHATLNCLVAKRLCDEDANCSAVLKIIPALCGPELVACSTITVSRCQAALRTLASFPWFQPTCLCKEPKIDPKCNSFRDLLFDHPCVFVTRKEDDMYPMEFVPSCNTASEICRGNAFCKKNLAIYQSTCRHKDGQCLDLDNREECLKTWLQARKTPLLGCICPDPNDSECVRLYKIVNENPCVISETSYSLRVNEMDMVGAALLTPLTRPLPDPLGHLEPPLSKLVAPETPTDGIRHSRPRHHHHYQIFHRRLGITLSDLSASKNQLKDIVNTCKTAYDECRLESGCRSHLDSVIRKCETCKKESCQSVVQDMYKYLLDSNQTLALQTGLCVCRQTRDKSEEECIRAQRILHPNCAEQDDTLSLRQCHLLGRECRNKRVCRYRLEVYEQACASDTLTGRCAGQHQECNKAVLGLLGSELHVNCVCKGDAFFNLDNCMDWKRLLWGNPCVVESQLAFQMEHQTDLPNKTTISIAISKEDPIHRLRTFQKTDLRNNVPSNNNNNMVYGGIRSSPGQTTQSSMTGVRYNHQRYYGRRGSIGEAEPSGAGAFRDGESLVEVLKIANASLTENAPLESPAEPTTPPSTTTPATTTRRPRLYNVYTNFAVSTTTPSLPERYCEISEEWADKKYIVEEGESIRLYKQEEEDCSVICYCKSAGEPYCRAVNCIEGVACETAYAVYNHRAPAYQAYRGECICYAGDFICMRPPSDEYRLRQGLYLLLGYSRTEEQALKNVTERDSTDALMALQLVIADMSKGMGNECALELYYKGTDNVVLQVKSKEVQSLVGENYTTYMLQLERDDCIDSVTKLAALINKKASTIYNDVKLSLFVLAEVVDNVPSLSSGSSPLFTTSRLSRSTMCFHLTVFVTSVGLSFLL